MKFKDLCIPRVRHVAGAAILLTLGLLQSAQAADIPAFRPPAVPLVTFNPYLSIWSDADKLTDDVTRHWTHHPQPLTSLVRIDGKTFRLMGNEPGKVPAFPQTALKVTPTRSIYTFDDGHVSITLTFMTAALPADLDALSQPLSYLTWTVTSHDGQPHQVELLDTTSVLLAVNTPEQTVMENTGAAGELNWMRAGTSQQPYLQNAGDDTRIDWGYVYVSAQSAQSSAGVGNSSVIYNEFGQSGRLAQSQLDPKAAHPAGQDGRVLAFAFDLGSVGDKPITRQVICAYDEVWSINYFGKKLRPYWRRNGTEPADMLVAADRNYSKLEQQCVAFDTELTADLIAAGGEKYADLCVLAYRECLAACGLAADGAGQPLLFTKENTSNGDLATVDVIFPMEPMLLLLSPSLTKASLVSNLDYAASPHWKFPNAPHDLGTYPICLGRDDGGEGMPVEESGNLILLCDALAHAEGNPKFVEKWWPQLTQWAKYLEQYGLDPEDQLCTDDFMGHLAHNANLSIKAILALGAYGDLARMRGDTATADRYLKLAKKDAAHFVKTATEKEPSPTHTRLAFDRPHTWSQKYNLVWDKLLKLDLFPPSLSKDEIAFYKTVMQPYGLPLDSRTKLTKTDWSIWTATLADNPADFRLIVDPMHAYFTQTSARVPIADSFITDDLKSSGMHARPVVGGFFIKMLENRTVWNKWAARDQAKVGPWAALPKPPEVVEVVATARKSPQIWKYTTQKPAAGWSTSSFDDSQWQEGPSGFGTDGTPAAVIGTVWKTDDIWLRRTVQFPATIDKSHLQLVIHHDEDAEVYINGVLAANAGGYLTNYALSPISDAALAAMKPGANQISVHCHQTIGGQYIDVGFANVIEAQ